MSRTALIIEAPPSKTLITIRNKLATDARLGVPPHLTVLFPFVPAEQFDSSVSESLSLVVGEFRPFDFSLTHTGWFGDSILWLGPEQPAPFVELTDAIVRAFPEYPPYEGRHDAAVPHLTLGDSGSPIDLKQAERIIRPKLPLASTAKVLSVLQQGVNGRWHLRERIPFTERLRATDT